MNRAFVRESDSTCDYCPRCGSPGQVVGGEVLDWFDQAGLSFVRGVPSVSGQDRGIMRGELFRPAPVGSKRDRLASQLKQIVTGSREGGFFLMIAQRPDVSSSAEKSTREYAGHQLDPVTS